MAKKLSAAERAKRAALLAILRHSLGPKGREIGERALRGDLTDADALAIREAGYEIVRVCEELQLIPDMGRVGNVRHLNQFRVLDPRTGEPEFEVEIDPLGSGSIGDAGGTTFEGSIDALSGVDFVWPVGLNLAADWIDVAAELEQEFRALQESAIEHGFFPKPRPENYGSDADRARALLTSERIERESGRAPTNRELAAKLGEPEPPRVCRRLHCLRGWSHGKDEQVFEGGP